MYFGQIEGTEIVVLDERFKGCFAGYPRVERLWTGCRWAEGPAWFAAGRYLVWSDIPNNRMLRYVEPSGEVSLFREPSNNSNGNTVDNQGRLVTCEHLTRRVTRTEYDGSIKVLAERWGGLRFNSPNDVVVKSDDSIWFTDPAYGVETDLEGEKQPREIDGCHVYRVDPSSGEVERVIDDMARPNGLAFSPDESLLYVADTGATHAADGPRHIRRFKVVFGRALAQRRRGVRRMQLGPVRWFSRRCGGAHLDQHRRRRARLPPRWRADRQGSDPRDRRQPDVRRDQAQHALHPRHDFALRGFDDDQGLQGRLNERRQCAGSDSTGQRASSRIAEETEPRSVAMTPLRGAVGTAMRSADQLAAKSRIVDAVGPSRKVIS